jgi:catechol 2,3-dioxygenase
MSNQAALPAATHIGTAALTIANLDRSVQFYTRVLGFHELERNEQTAVLGTQGGNPLLALVQQSGATPQPAYTTGLYHIATLLPSRNDLARVLAHMAQEHYPLSGFADHLVSEALYLDDPDGNGLELYRDRPRAEWHWQDDGQVRMASDPLDVQQLLNEGLQSLTEQDWQGFPEGTMVGHMHLRVGNIQQAEQFYHGLLGFDIIAHMPQALFVSAGGYHHHIGLNTWQSKDAPRPSVDSVGLRFFTVALPNQEEVQKVCARLQTAGVAVTEQKQGFLTRDPWGNVLFVTNGPLVSDKLIQ